MSKQKNNVVEYISERASELASAEEKRVVANEITQRAVKIVQQFLIQKKRVLYGGKAINDSLPKKSRFYDPQTTIPDYDFYTPTAKEDAVEIAKRLHKNKVPYVEVKTSAIHETTFKVFADFIPIVDATGMRPQIFHMIQKEASIGPEGILLASPDWLRMNMYLELARPKGDVSRWEKVSQRLELLNTHRPLKIPSNEKCRNKNSKEMLIHSPSARGFSCYSEMMLSSRLAAEFISKHKLLMVGGNSLNLYILSTNKKVLQDNGDIFTSDYDVLSNNPKKHAEEFRKILIRNNIPGVSNSIGFRKGIPELIPDRFRVSFRCRVGKQNSAAQKTVIDFYQNDNCWSYHSITVPKLGDVRVASIETLITFLFKWLFFLKDKLGRFVIRSKVYCIIEFLLHNQQQMKNTLFYPVPKNCYGTPVTLNSIRKDNWEGPTGGPPFRFRPAKPGGLGPSKGLGLSGAPARKKISRTKVSSRHRPVSARTRKRKKKSRRVSERNRINLFRFRI